MAPQNRRVRHPYPAEAYFFFFFAAFFLAAMASHLRSMNSAFHGELL
jgi:hypothetical protein